MLKENEQDLSDAIFQDLHKSNFEFYWTELQEVYQEIQDCLDDLHTFVEEEWKPTDWINHLNWSSSRVRHDPYGLVLLMAPWNYPAKLLLQPLAGAIACGNCVFVKGPDLSSVQNTAKLMATLLAKYLDSDCIKIALGDVEIGAELLKYKYDMYYYCGGPGGAKFVAKAAAEYLSPTVFELGGQTPCVIDETCAGNMTHVAKRICWGAFTNSGQTCVPTTRQQPFDQYVQLLPAFLFCQSYRYR